MPGNVVVDPSSEVFYALKPGRSGKLMYLANDHVRHAIREDVFLLPGNCRVSYRPDLGQLYQQIEKGYIPLDIGDDATVEYVDARPVAAAITRAGADLILHPPATPLLAVERVSARLGQPYQPSSATDPLFMKLIAEHYPDTLLPAGRQLRPDERQMSIAYVVDLEREENEPVKLAVARARPKLLEYGLVSGDEADSTLLQYTNKGLCLLRQAGVFPWEVPRLGCPPKNV